MSRQTLAHIKLLSYSEIKVFLLNFKPFSLFLAQKICLLMIDNNQSDNFYNATINISLSLK